MKTWTTIDKSEWPRGKWDDEPDKVQWIDGATGLDCLIVRGPSGALCGYVGVPKDHKYYKKEYGKIYFECPDGGPDIQGGLTFSDKCMPNADPKRDICHTGNIANHDVWWLGFDCAHSGDFCPAYQDESLFRSFNKYRNLDYVKNQVRLLAWQLSENIHII